jgi:hypothetical protein
LCGSWRGTGWRPARTRITVGSADCCSQPSTVIASPLTPE